MSSVFQDNYFAESGVTKTIQNTPNLSATMPKRAEKNVFASGISTFPPPASALKALSASAYVLTVSESAKPSKFGLPVARPSDAMMTVSPI